MKLVGVQVGKAIVRCVEEFNNGKVAVVKKEKTNQRSVVELDKIVWINRG